MNNPCGLPWIKRHSHGLINNSLSMTRISMRLGLLQNSSGRLRFLQAGMVVLFVTVCLRLVQVQIVESGKYRDYALKQYQAKVVLPATRGSIYDRNGNAISSNTMF